MGTTISRKTEMENKTERRAFVGTIEARAEGDQMPKEIRGIAAVVDETTDLGMFEERIAPGAFTDALGDDVRVLGNHDPNIVLGRTASGTASIYLNDEGQLAYSFAPDYENPTHVSWVRSIMRGDITQSSFAFTVAQGGTEWRSSEKYGPNGLRVIKKIDRLFDVSPVTYPAYEGTAVSARDLQAAQDERETLDADKHQAASDMLKLALARYKNY
ncbi:MAG: HK97 family phage prohead protease [Ilumatobacteraceae bacterium]